VQIDAQLGLATIGFLTLLANQIYANYTRKQERRWDEEDRQRRHDELKDKIEANTDLTREGAVAADKAFSEANHLNLKLVALGSKLVDVREVTDPVLVTPVSKIAPELARLDPLKERAEGT
jgi:hypothetical protein